MTDNHVGGLHGDDQDSSRQGWQVDTSKYLAIAGPR
jgi:hypothetical protein